MVRYWHKADMSIMPANVCFRGKAHIGFWLFLSVHFPGCDRPVCLGHITAKTIVQRAMQRLEAKGRGILLLHDIHPATAMALPTLLQELKARGFRVVQVVAAGDRPKFVPELLASPAAEKAAWPNVLKTRRF